MRGSTAKERRADELQTLTTLGLVADDVVLAALEYPTFGAAEERAVQQLAAWIQIVEPPSRPPSPIRRRQSISDPSVILHHAAVLTERSAHAEADPEPLHLLRDPLGRVLAKTAGDEDVSTVHDFAETLSRVTLMLTNQLESERGSKDWTLRVSNSSVGP